MGAYMCCFKFVTMPPVFQLAGGNLLYTLTIASYSIALHREGAGLSEFRLSEMIYVYTYPLYSI